MKHHEAMCSGKIGMTWAQAQEVLARYRSKDKRRQSYHCPICRAWHLGRPPKKIRWS